MVHKGTWLVLSSIIICCGVLMFRNAFLKGDVVQKLIVESENFSNGQRLPVDHTCDGKDISPQLSWKSAPQNTKSFAIVCDDPDAPGKTWVHWLVFNIPPTVTSFSAGVSKDAVLDNGIVQGVTSFGTTGFGGACPPKKHGNHRYYFKVYALDTMLNLTEAATVVDLEGAMQGHILATGQLMGMYSRNHLKRKSNVKNNEKRREVV